MPALRIAAVAVAVLTMTFVVLGVAPVSAASRCPEGTEPASGSGFICIPVVDPGDDSQPVGHGQGSGGTSSGPKTCRSSGKVIPCEYAGGGSWSPSRQCYLVPTSQPPAGSDMWRGNNPSEGRLYACVKPGVPGNPTMVFVPNGEETPADPAELAARALGELKLTVPTVRMAPTPPGKTYVGLETWLWMPESQWATLKKSVTAGSTTVTVTAEPRRVDWDMGAGSTSCFDAGRAWVAGRMQGGVSTSCAYTYQRVSDFQPGKKFAVSATISFRATWTCTGDCLADEGSLGEVDGLPGRSTIQVGERQAVNVAVRDER